MAKILVIDDDDELVQLLKVIFMSEGYQVSLYNSTQFTKVIEDVDPDLILLDIWFNTQKDGEKLAKAINQNEKLSQVPLILMSSDPNLEEMAMLVKPDSWVSKPLNIGLLLFKIEQLLAANTDST